MSAFDRLAQNGAASSSILVALAVSIFTILTLFTQVVIFSFAWLILSIAYAFTCTAGVLVYRSWATSEILRQYYLRHETDHEGIPLNKIIGDSKIRKFFLSDAFKDIERFHLAAFVILILLSIVIWVAFALQYYRTSLW